ncbi:MAG: hypothetical protein UY23_C0001G0388 [Candidatus Jorgensenbacteria bacterium GW2011_GWA1_48_11]|uniref:Uncharacterized protein n=1 Tax=Candidatus Jorgensenbacteria bacterium GW2011_GWA1_48_11 TaxID=1618660 RepID=A0A0G1UCD6_9BACT|nr:MAG: hypothetical protein UY23_C0001G0388 [Candidatus Jorgensenbacteria bacterium GW2011_GWA1_48_11]KKW12273.1 MAG: hypothetical protein UY51_C0005G0515 [Candidatus Jorgensenbacteria bacterium GW2011_GWB1_49_9]
MKPMKTLFTPFVVLIFLGISVFGFAALHNGMHGASCLASTLGGGVCVPSGDGFGFASFHLNAFKIFSNATFELALIVLVIFLIVSLALVFAPGGSGGLLNPSGEINFRPREVRPDNSSLRQWLTLFEKRDPALSF